MKDFRTWLEAARRGERPAREELAARFGARIRARVRRRLDRAMRAHVDSEDLTQSVLVSVLADLGRFEDRGPAAFAAWLNRRTDARVVDRWRRLRARGLLQPVVRFDADDELPPRAAPTPSTAASLREESARLRAALAKLSSPDHRLVAMRIESGLDFGEIARRLRLPSADAARKRYARALLCLRATLDTSPTVRGRARPRSRGRGG